MLCQLLETLYNVGNKKSKDYKLSTNAIDIGLVILAKLDTMEIDEKTYEAYCSYMKENISKDRKDNGEILRKYTRSINHWKDKQKNFILNNSQLKIGDDNERKFYEETKREIEQTILKIQEEVKYIDKMDNKLLLEFEVIFGIMKNAGDYYGRGLNVQKRKITEIFFSNMIFDKEKGLTLEVKPLFNDIFNVKIANGAGDATRTRNQQLGRLGL